MKRTAGFGYGTKFDFTKTAKKTPAPDTYNIQSIFTNSSGKVKGSSIGIGREVKFEKFKFLSILEEYEKPRDFLSRCENLCWTWKL